MTWTWRPSSPPFWLTWSCQISYPCFAAWPGSEKSPVSGSDAPILIGFPPPVVEPPLSADSSSPPPQAAATSARVAARRSSGSHSFRCIDGPPSGWLRDERPVPCVYVSLRLSLLLCSRAWVERHELQLGHLLDRVAQALAAEAGLLDAAVRHVVDAERRHVVDDQAADLDAVEGAVDDAHVVREEPRLQPEVARAGRADRVVDVVEAEDADERRERLLARHAHLLAHVREHRRLPEPPLALAAGDSASALVDRLAHPLVDTVGGGVVDQRPHVGVVVQRVARPERPDAVDELRHELVVHVVVDVDALDRDAGLARLDSGAPGDSLRREREVSV